MKKISVIVAAHKKFVMPSDSVYLPVFVGAEGKEPIGYTPDNTGDNISFKNPYYCELTGLYWGWKNLDVDYLGLSHYRRHFVDATPKGCNPSERIAAVAGREDIEKLLQTNDIILPTQRNYYIENLYDHYSHTLICEPLDAVGEIIKEKQEKFYPEFLKLKQRKKAHMFNMFIMKKDIADKYCEWLFPILQELENRCPPDKYPAFHARYPGRISELLLDVYINTEGLKYAELKVADMQKVNWLKKGAAFLRAKFTDKKYDASF